VLWAEHPHTQSTWQTQERFGPIIPCSFGGFPETGARTRYGVGAAESISRRFSVYQCRARLRSTLRRASASQAPSSLLQDSVSGRWRERAAAPLRLKPQSPSVAEIQRCLPLELRPLRNYSFEHRLSSWVCFKADQHWLARYFQCQAVDLEPG